MPEGTAVSQIGASWRQRIDSLREYEVVRDGNMFGASLYGGCLFSSDYTRSQQMLASLLDRYEGRGFDEVITGQGVENDDGSCFVIRSEHEVASPGIDTGQYMEEVGRDLTLVHGIGPVTERRLRQRGYATVHDLVRHPRFRIPATRVVQQLSTPASAGIMELVGSRHARSHPLVLGAAAIHEPEDFVFLDIETLGLFSRPVILIGIGKYYAGVLGISQYLLRTIDEEPAALREFLHSLSGDSPALVTYNGKSFDLPYLQDRLSYYGLGAVSRIPHFDVLHFTRARWRNTYPSLRLSALEQEIFGIVREGDVPGQMIPEFYDTYLRTGNCGPLIPIIEHNRQDVLSLSMLFFYLIREIHGCC